MVNEVLVRLRERSVASIGQTSYSNMVGSFINDAKNQAETAWNWNANRSILPLNTIAGVSTYPLDGFGQQGAILSAWNDTSGRNMWAKSNFWADKQNYAGNVPQGDPSMYTVRTTDVNGDMQIELFPIPDDTYSLRFSVYIPQDELSAASDVIRIPWRPVVLLAVAMLAEEKGETGGSTSARYFEMADKAMSDAIAIDANRFPTELDWYV